MLSTEQMWQLKLELSQRYPLVGEGLHLGSRVGNGFEPGDVRPYQPGDNWRMIDHRATARTSPRTFMVRPRIVEHEYHVMVVVDLCGRSHWGGDQAVLLKTQVLQASAEVVIEVLANQEDKYGIYLVNEAPTSVLPRGGSVHHQDVLEAVRQAEAGGANRLPKALDELDNRRVRKELVVVCSDFLASGWEEPLGQLARNCELVAIQILDPWDMELPDVGRIRVKHPVTGQKFVLDTHKPEIRAQYAVTAARQQAHIRQQFQAAEAMHIVLGTGTSWFDELVQSMQSRPRRAA